MKYGTFGVRRPGDVLLSPDSVSHDEKRVESERGIDHKLLLRQTESQSAESQKVRKSESHKLLLP
jgi:hypothetical protein